MTFSIIVPDPALSSFSADDDLEAIYLNLTTCARRKGIFSGESVDLYVLHSTDSETKPKNVQVSYNFDNGQTDSVTKEGQASDETADLRSELIAQGQTDVRGKVENISVWKVRASIGLSKSKIGNPVTFVASMIDPSVSLENDKSHVPNGTKHETEDTGVTEVRPEVPEKPNADSKQSLHKEESNNGSGPVTIRVTETLPVHLPLMMKLKSTKPGGRNDILLSSLSIEASKDLLAFANDENIQGLQYTISRISVSLPSGKATKLSSLTTPAKFGLDDITCITYRLVNDFESSPKSDQAPETTHPLHITLEFQIEDKDGHIIASKIVSSWTPILDFSLMAPPISNSLKSSSNLSHSHVQSQFQVPQRSRSSQSLSKKAYLSTPTFATSPIPPYLAPGTPGTKSLHSLSQRAKSPNIALGRAQSTNALPNKPNKRNIRQVLLHPTSSSAVTVNLTTANYTTLSGLRLTFLGRLDVELGKIATLSIQAINLSQRTMHLSLIVKNPLKYNPVYNTTNVNSASSSNLINGREPASQGALVQNRQQLFQQYHQHKLETCGVIMLTNDIRLGPIEPNAVFESEFDLIGISKGVFNLQGLKIFDISSGDGIDFGKLMEVFVI